MYALRYALLCFLSVAPSSIAAPRILKSIRRQEPAAASTQSSSQACHEVMAYAEQGMGIVIVIFSFDSYCFPGVTVFDAAEVYDCLKNVPFDPAVATRFIDHYNHTMQYQSTLALLANPPKGYQQPAVNFQKGLADIRNGVTAGRYTTQYLFEADLQLLISRMHDKHVTLNAGIMAIFYFTSPYGIVSASIDGKKEPEVYFSDDIVSSRLEGWKPSPITHINGKSTVEFLSTFAGRNSNGYLEPHADWNSLMDSPAADIQGRVSDFMNAIFYEGEKLSFTLANNSPPVETRWQAVYTHRGRTGPLSNAGDFFNYFVLGLTPDGFDTENATNWWPAEYNFIDDTPESDDFYHAAATTADWGCSSNNATPNWCNDSYGAYPKDPIVAQADLNVTGDGSSVTGYLLEDIHTGVLSIPSFYQLGDSIYDFYTAVDEFIMNATKHNVNHIVIDLQQNDGGDVFLALSTFDQFFPGIEPYTGSRIKSHRNANILGEAYTQWWKDLQNSGSEADEVLHDAYADSEWIIAHHINAATGANFSSWSEYSAPSDAFSRTVSYPSAQTPTDPSQV